MGPFSLLTEILAITSKTDKLDGAELAKALNNTKSITERARKSIFVYPVLFSSGMADVDLDFDIAKFLELQYGIFTMMTVGLNPSVENGDISEYLKTISAEDFEPYPNLKYKVRPVYPNQIETWFNMFSEENKDFFEEYKFATEGKSSTVFDNDPDDDKPDPSPDPKPNPPDGDSPDPTSSTGKGRVLDEKFMETKIGKAAPTIINLDIKIKGYQQTFKIPIALKASPHFLKIEDLKSLLDSAVEDKRLLTRIIKLTSGEISFFKDFVFNMDRIKRDQDLYKRFGQHPWYQQFIARKEKNKAKRLGIIASFLNDKFKLFASAMPSNYLPTASIIMNVEELEQASKLKYGFLIKHDAIMWSILNHLSLLCIGVYLPDIDAVSFYFNGFKKPLLMRHKEMKSMAAVTGNDKIAEMMNMMMKRGIL